MSETQWLRRVVKPGVFVAALTPLAAIIWKGFTDGLGANPIQEGTHETGDWTLRLLLVTLALTPLRRITGWNALIRLRRMLGLFAFFYGCLHFSIYWVDQGFALDEIARDVAKRPYITVGFTAFVLLIPLAVTSTAKMIRRLGGRCWQLLHRLIYVSAIAGVVHYLWLVKADRQRPLIYGAVLAVLLAFRALRAMIVASRGSLVVAQRVGAEPQPARRFSQG